MVNPMAEIYIVDNQDHTGKDLALEVARAYLERDCIPLVIKYMGSISVKYAVDADKVSASYKTQGSKDDDEKLIANFRPNHVVFADKAFVEGRDQMRTPIAAGKCVINGQDIELNALLSIPSDPNFPAELELSEPEQALG